MTDDTNTPQSPRVIRVVMGIPYPYNGEVLLPGQEYTLPYEVGHALVLQNHASLPTRGRYARRDMRSQQ
jgi:hypothetical protein